MVMPHPEVDHYQARVTVEIVPVNRYGDKLEAQGGILTFKAPMKGKLSQIMRRVEALVEGEEPFKA